MSSIVIGKIKKEVSKDEILDFLGLDNDFTHGTIKLPFLEEESYLEICISKYENLDEENKELGYPNFGFVTTIMINKYCDKAEEIIKHIVEHFGGGFVIPSVCDYNNYYEI